MTFDVTLPLVLVRAQGSSPPPADSQTKHKRTDGATNEATKCEESTRWKRTTATASAELVVSFVNRGRELPPLTPPFLSVTCPFLLPLSCSSQLSALLSSRHYFFRVLDLSRLLTVPRHQMC